MQPAGCLTMLVADGNTVDNTRVTNLSLPSEYVLPFKQSVDAIMHASCPQPDATQASSLEYSSYNNGPADRMEVIYHPLTHQLSEQRA